MKHIGWRERLFKSTRGRILDLLRTRDRTVNELAEELRLTDNAVRAHLASLERDRLVVHSGTKPGFRKPHATYALGSEAEQLFPKAYGRLVSLLMSIFSRQIKPRNLRAGMRAAGQAVAKTAGKSWDDLVRERIFAPFYRASRTREIPGTGLGLHISRRIAEQHGGQLTLDSSSTVGSVFVLTLPLEEKS